MIVHRPPISFDQRSNMIFLPQPLLAAPKGLACSFQSCRTRWSMQSFLDLGRFGLGWGSGLVVVALGWFVGVLVGLFVAWLI